MFVDTAKITIKAGDGGDGCISFHREKYVAAGGPDGGDGGKGADIVFEPDSNLSTLSDFRYKRKYAGENGQSGKPNRCYGKGAKPLVIKVPSGTVIKDAETGLVLADMSACDKFIAAKGGGGGWGNCHFATSTRQVPRFAKSGAAGESLTVLLELKLLADVGLLGFPNVGKSTLISVVSEAKPNIANYHFTTLTPVLGVVRHGDSSFVMADIPGLIEGASAGAGLGHEFLRHIDRCRLLIHVVDVSGCEGRDPVSDFDTINCELSAYSEKLAGRPQIVAGNKTDIADTAQVERFRDYVMQKGYAFFPISAASRSGISELMNHVAEKLSQLPPIITYEPETTVSKPQKAESRDVTVTRSGNFYTVQGEWLKNVLNSVNFDDSESLQYFERTLRNNGVIKKLEKAGIQEGDTVKIYDLEFDYVK